MVIPTVPKRKEFLEKALKSVHNQTYNNIEIVVVNDDTISATEARNVGIERSNGKYVAFLDDDDEWYWCKIEKQVYYMEKVPDCPLVIHWSNDLRVGKGRLNKPKPMTFHSDLVKGFQISSTSSFFVRKKALEDVKDIWGYYFDTSLPTGHEYDLALRITGLPEKMIMEEQNYYVVVIPYIYCIQEVLMQQNKSIGQISSNWGKKIRGQFAFMHKWGSEYRLIDWIKRIGLMGLFFGGFFIGNKVMYPINFMKKRFEVKNDESDT